MFILGIDPSVKNIGLAIYDSDTGDATTHIIHPKRLHRESTVEMSFLGNNILFDLHVWLQEKKVDRIVIEYPNWQASTKGVIAMQQGYTLDLAFVVGVLMSYFNATMKILCKEIFTPTPMQWKGNMPKKATEDRMQKLFGTLQNISEHEIDALGMAVWGAEQPGISS